MPVLDFSGPYLKIERADHHINELERLLRRYVSDNVQRFRTKNQERALKAGRPLRTVDVPRHTPTVLGDALHNLRASLDHAYCILVEANGHTTTEFTKFPFGSKDWASIKGSVNGHIGKGNGPSEAVRDYIGTEIQPYPGGKHRLYDLHRLDIADKHQTILPTAVDFQVTQGRITSPDGRINLQVQNLRVRNPARLGVNLGTGILVDQNNLKSAFDITFGKGQPLEGERMLDTVRQLRDVTTNALGGLEQFSPLRLTHR